MGRWIQALSDNTILFSAVLIAIGAILLRLRAVCVWVKIRLQLFLSKIMRDSIRQEIADADHSGDIVTSISELKIEVHNLSSQHNEIVQKVDKLTSDIAMNRELGKERSDHAEARMDSLEKNLTTMLEAVLQVMPGRTPLYVPKDVTERG